MPTLLPLVTCFFARLSRGEAWLIPAHSFIHHDLRSQQANFRAPKTSPLPRPANQPSVIIWGPREGLYLHYYWWLLAVSQSGQQQTPEMKVQVAACYHFIEQSSSTTQNVYQKLQKQSKQIWGVAAGREPPNFTHLDFPERSRHPGGESNTWYRQHPPPRVPGCCELLLQEEMRYRGSSTEGVEFNWGRQLASFWASIQRASNSSSSTSLKEVRKQTRCLPPTMNAYGFRGGRTARIKYMVSITGKTV